MWGQATGVAGHVGGRARGADPDGVGRATARGRKDVTVAIDGARKWATYLPRRSQSKQVQSRVCLPHRWGSFQGTAVDEGAKLHPSSQQWLLT
jgi:hypothetical protein